jgi:hypothetical protein
MIIYDFFAGTGSSTKAFENAGHTIISFELDKYFEATDHRDIQTLNAAELISLYGQPDFIWASPPCQKFSVASLWKYWAKGPNGSVPKHPAVYEAIDLIKHTIKLMNDLNPTYGWLMENPRAMLRKQDFMQEIPRWTVTYCQYGDTRMKPTDVWGTIEGWTPRPMCAPGRDCHESSPAGTNAGGTGKLRNARLRSMIPYELGEEICKLIERHAV